MRRKLLLFFFILVLLFIWGQSFLPTDLSRQESIRFLDLLTPILEFFLGRGKVTHLFIRKLAHFTEFFVLGCLISLLLPMDWKNRLYCCGFSLFSALLDETIQVFSDRGDQISDVWLDFAGSVAGILVITLFRCLMIKRKQAEKHSSSARP
ncbi:MAG: VanZ family protein [Oscillospiraceae bacterium]|nr:VanZ family protein [Oscillospiraceae bacterium]